MGDTVQADINAERRRSIMRNHTAAHLLQAALRQVLGTHVEQAGQLVDEREVRFDFTHFNAMTRDELLKVEHLVNAFIMGAHPVEAVQTMASIAATTEEDIDYKVRFSNVYPAPLTKNITSAIGHATVTTAHDLGAAAIVTVTQSGTTARMISKYRPDVPIIGATTEEKVLHQLMLSWGVVPVRCVRQDNTDALFDLSLIHI